MADIEVEILRTRARDGDVEAQFDLALRYSDGEGVPLSASTAFRWLRRAAEKGHVEAMAALGRCYHGGLGVSIDEREALHWYDRAFESGSDDVHLDLGQLLSAADSAVRDVERALLVLEEGWEVHADPACAGLLGELFEEELADPDRALSWTRVAAEGGDTSAMVSLGYRYRFGEGVSRSFQSMLRWYRAAADDDDATAVANLAICYQNGEGVPADPEHAFELRDRAARLGHAGSRVWLAFALIDGTGCEPEPSRGRALLELLAQEDAEVAHDLADRLLDGPGLERDVPAGLRLMRSAADRGHAPALTYLGVLHWYGKFVDEDRDRAIELYRRAMEFGDPYAVANVGFAMLEGESLPRNVERGLEFLRSAAERGNAHAALWLASRLLDGVDPLPRDDADAVRLLETCTAEEEDGEVLFLLAELIRDGRGARQDLERALGLFQLAEINGRDTRVERGQIRRRLRGA
ncbi:MAG: tetratricopeptide repeat protein [Planctomycetota bacterium]